MPARRTGEGTAAIHGGDADSLVDRGFVIPNVDMLGGETLGSIPSLPAAMAGGMAGPTVGGRVAVPSGMPSVPSTTGQPSVGGVGFPGLGR